MVNPGKYNRRITFLRRASGSDEYGGSLDEWIPLKTVWASKNPILGREYFAALADDGKVEVKFNCRYYNGIDNSMRIQCGDEIFEILSAIDVKDRHEELLCYCRKVR